VNLTKRNADDDAGDWDPYVPSSSDDDALLLQVKQNEDDDEIIL